MDWSDFIIFEEGFAGLYERSSHDLVKTTGAKFPPKAWTCYVFSEYGQNEFINFIKVRDSSLARRLYGLG